MFVGSSSLSFIIIPLTLINITISMDKSSLAIGLIVFPVAYVFTAILPDLSTFAFSMAVFGPLTMINSTII
jgi:hypothetical protein